MKMKTCHCLANKNHHIKSQGQKRKQKFGRINQLSKARAAKLAKNNAGIPRTDHEQFAELEIEEEQHWPAPPNNEEGSDDEHVNTPMQSRSAKKLLFAPNSSISEETTEELDGFKILDMQLLANAIFQAAVCKHCRKGSLTLKKNGKHGLALKMNLECSNANCGHK